MRHDHAAGTPGSFVHQTLPRRVVFGAGSVDRVPEEVDALDRRRVLVIAGGSAAATGERVLSALGRRAAGHFAQVAQHVPDALAARARHVAEEADADLLCSIGGGSATGLAKAVGVERDVPIIAVPTTYAGSEATPVYGITGESKRTATDARALPRTVIYDPLLTTGLPPRVTAASAFNALAHAAAALCAPAHDPLAALHADEAARLIAAALPTSVGSPEDIDARGRLLLAAYLAGSALAAVGTGLHHRLCHVLGGRYALSHAGVHAALLPHTLARDGTLSAAGRLRLARALGVEDAAQGLHRLARAVGAPDSLAALGLAHDALEEAAGDAAAALEAADPRAADVAWVRALLADAYEGGPPRAAESSGTDEEERR